jgi:hypothetical protein
MDPQTRINQTVSLEDVWSLLQEINRRLKTLETAALSPEKVTIHSVEREDPCQGFNPAESGTLVPAELKQMDELARQYPAEPKVPTRSYATLEDAIAAAEEQNTPEHRERFRQACKRAHGVLKDSKAWGQGVDVVAEIRKLRDEEWPNLWEKGENIQAEAVGE